MNSSISFHCCTFKSFIIFLFISFYVYTSTHYRKYVMTCICTCRSENNFWESALPFYHMGTGNQIQIIRLSSWRLSLLSHLAGLPYLFIWEVGSRQSKLLSTVVLVLTALWKAVTTGLRHHIWLPHNYWSHHFSSAGPTHSPIATPCSGESTSCLCHMWNFIQHQTQDVAFKNVCSGQV